MSAPSKREIAAVSKIGRLSEEEKQIAAQIISLLGFNDQSVPDTGPELVKFCILAFIRPGVIQKNRNFDKKETLVKKGNPWQPIHKIFVDGHSGIGKIIRDLATPKHTALGIKPATLRRIGAGNQPVTLELLRELVRLYDSCKDKSQQLTAIANIVNNVPDGILTSADVQKLQEGRNVETMTNEDQKSTEQKTVWTTNYVTIDGSTFSLLKGPDMANVARRIRSLIARDPGKPNIGTILNLALSEHKYSDKAKVLSAVERGRDTLPKAVVEGVALHYEIPVEALFTGVGLGFADPALFDGSSTTTRDRALTSTDTKWARDLLFYRTTKLAEGAVPHDLVILALDKDNPEIDWVKQWLELTESGAHMKGLVEQIAALARPYGKEATELLLALTREKLLARFETDE